MDKVCVKKIVNKLFIYLLDIDRKIKLHMYSKHIQRSDNAIILALILKIPHFQNVYKT